MTDASLQALDHFTSVTKQGLLAYGALTALCWWLDLILLVVTFRRFSRGADPYSDIPLMLIAVGMLLADAMYASWLLSVGQRVPARLADGLCRAAGGQFETLYQQIRQYQAELKEKRAARARKVTLSRPDESANIAVVQRESEMARVES